MYCITGDNCYCNPGKEFPLNQHPDSVTPESLYLNRKEFMKGAAVFGSAVMGIACADEPSSVQAENNLLKPSSYDAITGYNNFYEFSTDKEKVAPLSKGFKTDNWTVEIGGLVQKKVTLDVDKLKKLFGTEERIYRFRCVEGWSMVIPWRGFSLNKLLSYVSPLASAKYVRFQTLLDPKRMPGQKDPWYDWPYTEGLRLDEAMNDLTILSTGLYGKDLLPQNGAPIRLVVPWKYGFKSIKSVVKIDLVDKQPVSLWMKANPREYGFYSNVNPKVDHPRWSQSSERRIGEYSRIKTLMFNGYEKEVAQLYRGMDLKKYF